MDVGTVLKQEIKKKRRSLVYVSEITHIPYQSLVKYVNNFRPIKRDRLFHICQAMEIDIKIFDGTGINSIQ